MGKKQQTSEELPELPTTAVVSPAEVSLETKRNSKPYLIGGAIAFIVLVVGWMLCSLLLSKITVGSTKIAARSSDTALAKQFDAQVATYKLSITYPNKKSEKFDLKTVGFTIDTSKSLISTRTAQHKFSNRLKWWKPVPAQLVFKENSVVLNDFTARHINITAQPSQDAAITITGGKIQIADAVTGKQYGLANPEATLRAAVKGLQNTPIKLQTLDINPALTASILQPYKLQLEKVLNQPASLEIGDRAVTPSAQDIAGWLDITPNDKTKKVDITVNSGKVVEYINKVAAASIHPPRAQVNINMPDGSVQTLTAGVSGSDVLNKSAVAKSLADNVLNAKGFDYSMPIRWQPFQTVTTNDYDKWIEVDLTNKRTYAYEHGNLVATFLASAGAPATPTVTGEYKIYAKYAQQNMQGENVDGSNYYQPHVQWINYFYRDYAIHGNYWRPLSYFGNVNSSHGCVGLVNGDALWIYNWAPVGTPVVVHT
jgi:lipoprotein-anchoring transpeptidase ErfK/SrfK